MGPRFQTVVIALSLLWISSSAGAEEIVRKNGAGQVVERYSQVDGKRQGAYVSYYDNGQKRFEGTYAANNLVGKAVRYHLNGKVNIEGSFDNGTLKGPWSSYSPEGLLLARGEAYRSDYGANDIEAPYRTGPWVFYHGNGQKRFEGTYLTNNLMGTATGYHVNGKVQYQATFENGGMKGIWTEFSDAGQVLARGEVYGSEYGANDITGPLRTGPWIFYHRNGQKSFEGTFVRNRLDGKVVKYHPNGKPFREAVWVNGAMKGLWSEYYDDGQLHIQGMADGNEYGPNDIDGPKKVGVWRTFERQAPAAPQCTCGSQLKRYLEVQQELAELEASMTFTEQFFLVKRSLDEATEVLNATGKGAVEKAEKIKALEDRVRESNERLRELIRNLASGLEKSGKTLKEVSETLNRISGAMDTLEIAVRARNASPTQSLESFGAYFNRITDTLSPLIQQLPVVGVFIEFYSQAISSIARDAASIERETQRRQRLAREITGRELYLTPGTEREAHTRRIEAKRAELENLASRIAGCAVHRGGRDAAGQPEDEMMRSLNRARELARQQAQSTVEAAERKYAELGRAMTATGRARDAYDQLRRQSNPDLLTRLADKRRELAALGPVRPLVLSGKMSPAERRDREQAHARHEALQREVQHLEQQANRYAGPLDRSSQALQAAQQQEMRLRQEAQQLWQQAQTRQRDFMLNEARAKGWDTWWVRFRYPDLFEAASAR